MTDNVLPVTDAENVAVMEPNGRKSSHARSRRTASASAEMTEQKSGAVPASQVRWRTARRLIWLLRPFRGTMLVLLSLSLAAVAIDVVPPLLQGALVDHVLRADPVVDDSRRLLLLLAGIVSGLLAIRVAALFVNVMKGKVSSRVGTTLTAYLRNALVERLSFMPLAFHNRNQVGSLMSRVAYDTETLHTLVYHITGGLLLQVLQLTGIGVMLFYLNPKLAVVTLLPMPLVLAGSWYFTRYLQPRYNHYWDAVGKQAGGLTGMLTGIRVVKTFAQEEREIDRFGRASRHLCQSRQTVDGSIATFSSLMGFVFALGGLAVWYIGGRDVLFGQMTLGSLMAFLAYLAMFYAPLTSISESTSWFSSFFATVDRIFDLLEAPVEASGEARGKENGSKEWDTGRKGEEGKATNDSEFWPLSRSLSPSLPFSARGGIEFEHVNFAYDKSKPVLKDVSFVVAAGEMVGIVGRSGSGKSTLVSLIGRLYEADSGCVLVGGVDTLTMEPRELRRHIGMVQQEPFLFRGSVWENITYGNTSAESEEVLIAARQADAHGFIMRLPFAYESHLGEGGAGLSGGERQRLSIARALLVDPDILILDEATASIDAESERAICAAIRRFSRRRTTIAIAHRLSTLRNADRLLVFDQGRLVEQGTHDELMELNGLYSSLVRLQYSSGPVEEMEDELAEVPWLEPGTTAVLAEEDGTLRVDILKAGFATPPAPFHCGVIAAAAFPATLPDEFISLRRREADGRETEIGVIRHLEQWPAAVRAAVRRSIQSRQVLHRIEEFRCVRTCGSALELTVATAEGVENVRMEKSGDGLQRYGRRGLLLIDGAGRRFVVHDRNALPTQQQQLLSLYFGEQI